MLQQGRRDGEALSPPLLLLPYASRKTTLKRLVLLLLVRPRFSGVTLEKVSSGSQARLGAGSCIWLPTDARGERGTRRTRAVGPGPAAGERMGDSIDERGM